MQVWHMNGAGNDFLVLDARKKRLDFENLAKKYCAQLGADGLMAIDNSEKADFRLHFYNADGSRGEMCGNGSRCVCRFAHALGIVGSTMTLETDAGLVCGWRLDESTYRVRLNDPAVLDLNRKSGIAYTELGCPGVPHAVTEMPGLQWDNRDALREKARALRFDPAFPKGANVNFYTWLATGRIRLLTFERGVEDFTLACGTGTGSAAVVLWAQGKLPEGRLIAENMGGTLTATVQAENGRATALLLEGPTQVTEILELPI